jgi:hypothetical protein
MLAAGGASGLLAAIAWCIFADAGIDDGVGLLGIPVGVALGFLVARATRRRRGVHRALVIGGALGAAAATAGAMNMFAAARAARGDGPFVGLGEALAGLVLLAAAAVGIACIAAGTTGWLATRTAPGQA